MCVYVRVLHGRFGFLYKGVCVGVSLCERERWCYCCQTYVQLSAVPLSDQYDWNQILIENGLLEDASEVREHSDVDTLIEALKKRHPEHANMKTIEAALRAQQCSTCPGPMSLKITLLYSCHTQCRTFAHQRIQRSTRPARQSGSQTDRRRSHTYIHPLHTYTHNLCTHALVCPYCRYKNPKRPCTRTCTHIYPHMP